MTRCLGWALSILLLLCLTPSAPATATEPAEDWRGSAGAKPSDYDWVDDETPDLDYEVVVVRGLSAAQVRRTLGTVKRQLRTMSPARAEAWVADRTRRDYTAPRVALVDDRGPAVVVYLPYWVQPHRTLARLSRLGVAVHFTTTVEQDTYVTVARRGTVVRSFDAAFRPPRRGALPAEQGLDWGARTQNVGATAWAFLERVSRIHLSQEWFDADHPAYVVAGSAP